jgi:hypothetical protein
VNIEYVSGPLNSLLKEGIIIECILWKESEIVSIANGLLEENFLVDQVCSPFTAHEPISTASFELKFENSLENDHQLFGRYHRNNFEGIKILWR